MMIPTTSTPRMAHRLGALSVRNDCAVVDIEAEFLKAGRSLARHSLIVANKGHKRVLTFPRMLQTIRLGRLNRSYALTGTRNHTGRRKRHAPLSAYEGTRQTRG